MPRASATQQVDDAYPTIDFSATTAPRSGLPRQGLNVLTLTRLEWVKNLDTLLDGFETGSGLWVSATSTGTSPLLTDTDGDGLPDNVENPALPYSGPSQPGTNPNLADTDGDTFPDGLEVNWPSNPFRPSVKALRSSRAPAVAISGATAIAQSREKRARVFTNIPRQIFR